MKKWLSFKKYWFLGLATGFIAASLTTLIITVWEWIENPGGIFRDSSGTNWGFVYDTAISWFPPTFLYISIDATVVHAVLGTIVWAYKKKRFAKQTSASR